MIQEEEIPKKETEQIPIEDKPKSKLIGYLAPTSTADRIAYVALIMAIIFGFWGIRLTYKGIQTSVDLNHFETLLSKTDSSLLEQEKLVSLSHNQIDTLISINRTLASQLDIISKQYAINLQEQRAAYLTAKNSYRSNEQRFKFAAQNLQSTELQFAKGLSNLLDMDFAKRAIYVNAVEVILSSQTDNPFLLSNRYMLKDWTALHDTITKYKTEEIVASAYTGDGALKIRNDAFLKFCFTTLYLSSNTNQYVREYEKKYPLFNKYPNSPDLYKSIRDSKNKKSKWQKTK